MQPTPALHPLQAQILRTLVFTPAARFRDLNGTHAPTDQFSFHLKSLVAAGLVQRSAGGYSLTAAGKEYAGRRDTDGPAAATQLAVEVQPKVGVAICPVRTRAGRTEYLIQQRLKQPYYGYHGFLTGKARAGERLVDTAARELQEEAGLTATLKLVGIRHKTDRTPAGQLLEDKLFFVFRATDCRGSLVESFEGGANRWMTRAEFLAIPERYEGVEQSFALLRGKALRFVEFRAEGKGF